MLRAAKLGGLEVFQFSQKSPEKKNQHKNIGGTSDVKVLAFWQGGQVEFFNIRVFNPMAKRYSNHPQKVF